MSHPTEPGDTAARLPSGAAVRRWTRRVTRSRAGSGAAGDLLSDLYTVVLSLVVSLTMVVTALRQIGGEAVEGRAADGRTAWWLATGLVVTATLGLVSLLARIGPVSVAPHQARWWLSLPVDRGSLLWPTVRGRALISAAVMAIVCGVAGLVAMPRPSWHLLLWILGGALGGLTAASALVTVQAGGGGMRTVRVADALLGAAAMALVAVVLWSPAPPVSGAGTGIAGTMVLAAVAPLALWRSRRALPRLHDVEMSERGGVADHLRGATSSLDTRELGRALTVSARWRPRPPARLITSGPRRRAGRIAADDGTSGRRVPATRPAADGRARWAAIRALLVSDLLLVIRAPRRIVQLACGAVLPVIALTNAGAGPVMVTLCCVAGAWIGALGLAEGARRGELSPAVEELLPLGQRAVRGVRVAGVTVGMLAWSLPVAGVLAHRTGDPAWFALLVLLAPTWAGGAVRSAYRPYPDWSAPLIVTPMGAFPPALASVASAGPDVVVLGAIPLAVAVLTGGVPLVLLGVQAALTAVVVAIAAHPPEAKR